MSEVIGEFQGYRDNLGPYHVSICPTRTTDGIFRFGTAFGMNANWRDMAPGSANGIQEAGFNLNDFGRDKKLTVGFSTHEGYRFEATASQGGKLTEITMTQRTQGTVTENVYDPRTGTRSQTDIPSFEFGDIVQKREFVLVDMNTGNEPIIIDQNGTVLNPNSTGNFSHNYIKEDLNRALEYARTMIRAGFSDEWQEYNEFDPNDPYNLNAINNVI